MFLEIRYFWDGMQRSDCFYSVHFLIADTYSDYNKIGIKTYLNRMGFYFFKLKVEEKKLLKEEVLVSTSQGSCDHSS